MAQQISLEILRSIMQAESIEQLSMQQINELFHAEKDMMPFLPDSICQIDPRNGELIVYNSTGRNDRMTPHCVRRLQKPPKNPVSSVRAKPPE
ncbi:MAG: hypothetical protein HC889_00265 [Synechococcaceae cyanobacterium SM1_2_3]|nr:hypothetical protein [Synechococcaceae cyanobacterium SM1_2_3]